VEDSKAQFNHPIVLIWTDEPSLVIGRHQNPWIESNLGLVNKLGIKIARRHSGGGCVYHDENNINISIIGERRLFENRQENLRFLAKIIKKKYDIDCEPNKRHDLIHSATGCKMSGSAAKLGRHNSYHHFTLLVNTDKELMKAAIRPKTQEYIHTNSTNSTRSTVINLNECDQIKPGELTTNQVISDLAQEYGEHYCGANFKQPSRKSKTEGDEDDLASLTKIREDLMSWSWIYGMTPKFKLERLINLNNRNIVFKVHIDRGLFKSFEIECDEPNICAQSEKFASLLGTSFSYKDAMVNVVKMLQVDDLKMLTGYEQIFATHLLQMIHEANF
jgi:lipoyltransferase 1